MKIIKTILESEIFSNQPPVLFDIGASGEINQKWKSIAPYSICVAFDADDREFKITEQTGSGYKKLYSFNRIVTIDNSGNAPFHLTSSPFCSSLLEPDPEKLKPWIFNKLFQVEKTIILPSMTIAQALDQLKLNYVDWFKTDTQGTDLRLFRNLSSNISDNILAAEFEPGIIDAYKDEDKLFRLMEEMQGKQFWLSSMDVKGVQRISPEYADQIGGKFTKRIIRKSPGWAEVTYLRSTGRDKRQLLLLTIFALIEAQYGFALELADQGIQRYKDDLFSECKKAIWSKINSEKPKTPLVILKRQFNKLFSKIND
ncbi:MAG: hypothetical protein C5B52_15505 [Bacteroidetes bacterium]|nr:MAG: hypothetical protein C5B52_15505 [Bacteroidota bacterium]